MTVGQLDTNLRRFYAEARNKSGESYSKPSLLGFRHLFERYLNAPPLSRGLKLNQSLVTAANRSLSHYNTQPSTSQLRTCNEILSRSLTSDRSESLAVIAIKLQKEVQENSIVVSTATEKTTSGFGSFFNNCTVKNVHVTVGIYCQTVFSVYSTVYFR